MYHMQRICHVVLVVRGNIVVGRGCNVRTTSALDASRVECSK